MRPEIGQVISNKYRLLRLIGDGGMGSVYEARHEILGTSVALKFLHSELASRTNLVQRFMQEARVSAQIQSPHVVRVTDVGADPAGAFIVMEYLQGKTLQTHYEQLYQRGERLGYNDALDYGMQMLEGVEAAHRAGIVHRDLKPDNVMITMSSRGRPLLKLLDFGIAKLRVAPDEDPSTKGLTRPGVIMGTPEYMAPEQAYSAAEVDARADIFSLGVLLFEMLAGRRPVGGEDPQEIAGAYLAGQVARLTDLAPTIAPALAAAVHRAMAPLAEARWSSVGDFRAAIEPFAVAAGVPLTPFGNSSLSNPAISLPALLSGQGLSPLPPSVRDRTDPDPQRPSFPGSVPSAAGDRVSTPGAGPAVAAGGPAVNGSPPPNRDAASASMRGALGAAVAAGAASAAVPATALHEPFVPEAAVNDPGATAFATPIAFGQSFESSARQSLQNVAVNRPGGTAIGDRSAEEASARLSQLQVTPAPVAIRPSMLQPPPAIQPRAGADPARRHVLASLPAILLLATGVSALVVGGLYLAHLQASADDREELSPIPTATALVSADPQPTAEVPPPVRSIPPVPTAIKVPTKSTAVPLGPRPPGTAPSAAPSAHPPPILPSVFVVPSAFPLPFPFPLRPPPFFQMQPPDDPPRSRPEGPPPRTNPRPPRRPPSDPYGPPQRPPSPDEPPQYE